MFIAAFLVCFIAVVDAIPDDICGEGWIYSHGNCYTSEEEDVGYILESQAYCESLDPNAYVMVVNTKEEMIATIKDGVLEDDGYYMFGLYTTDNGTTWKRFDGSKKTTYFETLSFDDSTDDGVGDHLECSVYENDEAECSFYYPDTGTDVICEKLGPYYFPEPCKMKLHKKLRRGATRMIRMKNEMPGSCYIEIKGKRFAPAQLKVYGYNVPCDSGFYVQTDGEPMEMVFRDKFTCGLKSGQGRSVIKKRSVRGGIIRLYFGMSGDGNMLKVRLKGKSFM